jgi:RsiW-degrading membrane proteinase PrsW (M82 family)
VTLATLPALLVGLFCAALFILLFQYLFPRRAPWLLVACALASGIAVTLLLVLILGRFVEPGLNAIQEITSLPEALRFAALRAALPEEATKSLATLLALLPFWRRATPAQAFQAALFVAIGFAAVENRGYVAAFQEYGLPVAFGRGFLATFIHAIVAMIFGGFLMRFAAGGWKGWHLVILGYLAAGASHTLHDAGLLLPAAEYLRTGTVTPETLLSAVPAILLGFGLLLVWGFWSLRGATRRATAGDPLVTEPRHQAAVRRWRRAANILLALGLLGFAGAIAWAALSEAVSDQAETMRRGLIVGGCIAGALFAFLLSFVLRQKR